MVRVVLGGTFEYLHAGHSQLIEDAFLLLKEKGDGIVHIGLTSDKMARSKNHSVSDYESREKALHLFISNLLLKLSLPKDCYFVSRLEDPVGPSVAGNYDYIVVSPETRKGAEEINSLRLKNGLPAMKIHEISFVLAEDTFPISSTRIYNGEIDKDGRIKHGRIQK